jgi:copper chaperone CopZ
MVMMMDKIGVHPKFCKSGKEFCKPFTEMPSYNCINKITMKTLRFKTNVKCSGCIEKITPNLNEAVGEGNWSVDLNDPRRILTVTEAADDELVKKALTDAGYKGETI